MGITVPKKGIKMEYKKRFNYGYIKTRFRA